MTIIPKLSDPSRPAAQAVAARGRDQFGEVYQEFYPRLFAYVYGRVENAHLAEDLVADVFERAFIKVATLRNQEAFSTWLFTIARNVVISHFRKSGRETVVDSEALHSIAPAVASVEHEVLVRDEVSAMVACLREFPQREQDIVALKFDAGLSNSQIAQVVDLGETNVRVILFRTLRKLRQTMADRGDA
ncbi:MAG: sigma-70 family RNA polymerase sigma factor [Dehalococcoidia bacterium]